ncbi:MAG: hypothetical protein AB1345_05095 [Chloroflexota bacterium]
MYPETTTTEQYTAIHPHLYMAFELGQTQWKLGFTIGFGQRPRLRTIVARDLVALRQEIELAKGRFDLLALSGRWHHPHVHYPIPAGGLAADGQAWLAGCLPARISCCP